MTLYYIKLLYVIKKDINPDKDITKKINIKSLLQYVNLKENIIMNDGDNVYIEKAGIW